MGIAVLQRWAGWTTVLPVSKRWVRKAWCDFFTWLGSYCQKWFLLALKLGLKNTSLLAPDRDASWNLGNCFTAVFGRKFWPSELQHDWYVLFGFLRIFLYSHDSNPFEFFLQTMCLYILTSIASHWIFWHWAVEDGGVFFHWYTAVFSSVLPSTTFSTIHHAQPDTSQGEQAQGFWSTKTSTAE